MNNLNSVLIAGRITAILDDRFIIESVRAEVTGTFIIYLAPNLSLKALSLIRPSERVNIVGFLFNTPSGDTAIQAEHIERDRLR